MVGSGGMRIEEKGETAGLACVASVVQVPLKYSAHCARAPRPLQFFSRTVWPWTIDSYLQSNRDDSFVIGTWLLSDSRPTRMWIHRQKAGRGDASSQGRTSVRFAPEKEGVQREVLFFLPGSCASDREAHRCVLSGLW